MKYFITGHTGFKGSWLCVMLKAMGHEVHGFALDPTRGSLFEQLEITNHIESDVRADILDKASLEEALRRSNPDYVVHLAAQSLVRLSYEKPELTFQTNVVGTLNLLDALRNYPNVRILAVTTDKVYKDLGEGTYYVEDDPLSGSDPYSASKAMMDLLVQSWSKTYPGMQIAIARAGNVIGPFDTSADRLMPDILRAKEAGYTVTIRNPNAIRPWQYVLDCLRGYLLLLNKKSNFSGAWNFGPRPQSEKSVLEFCEVAQQFSGVKVAIGETDSSKIEQQDLRLESSKARLNLGWEDLLSFEQVIETTLKVHGEISDARKDSRWSLATKHAGLFIN